MKKRYMYVVLAFLLIFTSCSGLFSNIDGDKKKVEVAKTEDKAKREEENKSNSKNKDDNKNNKEKLPEDIGGEVDEKGSEDEKETAKTIRIKAFGDIIFHKPQCKYANAIAGGGEKWDFRPQFEYIKDFLADADFTIGNFEAPSRPGKPYEGYPIFNAPRDVFKVLKDIGIDVLTTANNHTLDMGVEGIRTTLDGIDEVGLKSVGTRRTSKDKDYLIYDANGIEIAILSYAEHFNGLEPYLKTEEDKAMANTLNPEKIKKDIEEMRKKADLVLVYPHWGEEYREDPTRAQVDLARNMVEWGADLVIGNHPHIVEPAEWYTAKDGRKGFIAYACGNFISNQRIETLDMIRPEQGVIFEIEVTKDPNKGNKTSVDKVINHPLWVSRVMTDQGYKIQTRLAKEYLEGGKRAGELKGDDLDRVKKAYDMTMEMLGRKVN